MCDMPHYSEDEIIPPDFLNQDFFEKILQQSENDKLLKITNLNLVPGTKPGDHFASIMFKAIISYTSKGKEIAERSLVIKTVPVEDGLKKDMLQDMPIFDREIDMYTKILPEMKLIMETINDKEEFAPRLIYQSTDPLILIFDDITKYGYEMSEGFFDFANTTKIVKKLAKFHALSFYMNDNKYNHIDVTKYKTLMEGALLDRAKVFFEGFNQLRDEVINWPGYETIAAKLGTQKETFMKKIEKVYQSNPDPGFNVLCHGDFHIKNMMFIKNGDNINKTMFVDYQMSFWGSPAIDLIYIFYAVGDADCRRRREEMLSIYHEALSEYLNRLGCLRKPPTLLELNIEMLKRGAAELLLSICFHPFFYLDYTKVDAKEIADPAPEVVNRIRKIMYTNEDLVKVLKEVLPDLLYRGVLA